MKTWCMGVEDVAVTIKVDLAETSLAAWGATVVRWFVEFNMSMLHI